MLVPTDEVGSRVSVMTLDWNAVGQRNLGHEKQTGAPLLFNQASFQFALVTRDSLDSFLFGWQREGLPW